MMQSCGDDVFRMEALLKMNIIEWLTYLQYMKQKGDIEIFLNSVNASK